MVVGHSIFDFQVPGIDLEDSILRDRLFKILRKYKSKGPVLSTDIEARKGCLFIFIGEDGG